MFLAREQRGSPLICLGNTSTSSRRGFVGTDDLAVLRVIAVKAHGLKAFGPTVSPQPAVHARSPFANLLAMLGS
jgi:hypothetical protein